MGWISNVVGRAVLLGCYRRWRERTSDLQNQIVTTLDAGTILECARKLGILRKNTVVFATEDEPAVLMDYCVYSHLRDGLNAVQRYFTEYPPQPGSFDDTVSKAMVAARYRLLRLTGLAPGIGVQVSDLQEDQTLFLVDRNCSQTTGAGLILATRTLSVNGFYMTTGAALPVPDEIGTRMIRMLKSRADVYGDRPAADQRRREAEAAFSTAVIRACLAAGASSAIGYEDPFESPRSSASAPPDRGIRRAPVPGTTPDWSSPHAIRPGHPGRRRQ